jgi:hypothetical protein
VSARQKVPYGETAEVREGLAYLNVEISYGSQWVSIHDEENYLVSGADTRDSTTYSWRKFTADSPILGGTYLIHAVPEMVTETIAVWVYGTDQTEVADNLFFLHDLFEQMDYRIRWTTNEYREYWRCQLAESSHSRGLIWTHSTMAQAAFQVPRFPDVTRERIA